MPGPDNVWGFSPLTVDLIRRAEALLADPRNDPASSDSISPKAPCQP
jgi:hypothetical protein